MMTNHSEWFQTNNNHKALCPVNIAGEVRLPNSCPVYIVFTYDKNDFLSHRSGSDSQNDFRFSSCMSLAYFM